MNNLVERMEQVKKRDNLTWEQFSNKLGFDRSYINYIRSGKRKISLKFLSALGAKFPNDFPELIPLAQGVDKIHNTPQTAQDGKLSRCKTWWGSVLLRAKKLWHNSREP